MAALVRVQGLEKSHGTEGARTVVLRGVSLDVEAGAFVCVMGPSGSGKSTLLHLIAGLDEPSGGTVELDGSDLAALSMRQRTLLRRRALGFVFQFFNLLPNLTVYENVALPLVIAGTPEEAERVVPEALERFGVAARRDAFPHQLSGGEMQRVSIARALAGGQRLLLCDEPTGNLSQKAGLDVMRILRRVSDEDGRTVLLVTHNPRDAAFADTVRFLVDGRLDGEHVLSGPGLTVEDVHAALAALSI
jgi:putative ABC transport system ATP-binding protein